MNKINYDKELNKLITSLKKSGQKPKLLLHCCCAPCATACIEKLRETFDITAYFYNPNMNSVEEYLLRGAELQRFCEQVEVECFLEQYDNKEFYDCVKGYEDALEGGERCFKCYALRLNKTAEKAKEFGYDYFGTTLTLSPLKNAEVLNELGYNAEKQYKVKYLASDFKKGGGYLLSIEMSKEYDLYRQNYCGCVFSKNKNP